MERLSLSGGLKNLFYSKLLLDGGLKKAPQEDPWSQKAPGDITVTPWSQKSPSGTSETLRWSRDPALPPLTSHGFLTSPASETETERGECENGTKNILPESWEKKMLLK